MSNFLNHSTVNGAVTSNIDKRPRSPSPKSDSSEISVHEVKRTRAINYLGGEGIIHWRPKVETIDNVNITKNFVKFRGENVKAANEGTHLIDLRVLSLPNVFPCGKNRYLTKYLKPMAAREMKAYLDNHKPKMDHCKTDAILYCKSVGGAVDFVAEDDMTKQVVDLVQQWLTNKAIAATSEASFTERNLMPFIRRILLDNTTDQTVFAVIDKPLATKQKPDFMLGARKGRKGVYFFFIEVKLPNKQSCYQVESDFVKLKKTMKSSIDDQLELGLLEPSSIGLLVRGYICTLYRMTLVQEGIYLPVEIATFRLVEIRQDILSVPTIIEMFNFVKAEFNKFLGKMNERVAKEQRQVQRAKSVPSFITEFISKK